MAAITLTITDADLALQRLYHFESQTPDRTVFTQPMGGGVVRDMTWRQVMDETRRMAAHLQGLGLEPGSKIAILSKNCAHWMMTDWAIWMAGYVSVPLYPTLAPETIRQILTHSESKLLFVGKLDGWEGMKPGVPEGMPCISYPLSPPNTYPTWEEIIKTRERLNKILAHHTGQPIEKIQTDTERDNFMGVEAAIEYGLVDKSLEKRL